MSSILLKSSVGILRGKLFPRIVTLSSRCFFSSPNTLFSKDGSESNIESKHNNNSTDNNMADELKTNGSDEKNMFNIDQMILENSKDVNNEVQEDEYEDMADDEVYSQILSAALEFVPQYGWTTKSIDEAVKSLELSSSTSGLFKRGGVDLVLHFIEESNSKLSKHLADVKSNVDNKMTQPEFIEYAVKTRLKMIIPYMDSWSDALKLLASPNSAADCVQLGSSMVDEMWYYAGDTSTDTTWYTKRAALSGIYIATELYMLTDKSIDFNHSWEFLHNRMQDLKRLDRSKHAFEDFVSSAYSITCGGLTTAQNILGLNRRKR